LSRALLALGRLPEARRRIERAGAIARESGNPALQWETAIAAARIQAASGNRSDIGESMRRLEAIVAQAASAGFPDLGLEARLALGEMELKGGDALAGRPLLEAVERDSARAGVHLLSLKADAALKMFANHAAN
jgi:hypothetical protein